MITRYPGIFCTTENFGDIDGNNLARENHSCLFGGDYNLMETNVPNYIV